ncbi:unnamed protein product [Prunus armeniaca]|uniref:RING-type domain-containing protein n=1 Tax=Prunus armeniaca TaxID=36596 RepID=A0A6J5UMU5_PRUAR|nr:hypothetical protein GBA52_014358 [Prunus armeniaca]CAB4277836.1 unnamed protein product [Prunus armeniaca]
MDTMLSLYDAEHRRCPICWKDVALEQIISVSSCSHYFHWVCNKKYEKHQSMKLKDVIKCPVCRHSYPYGSTTEYVFTTPPEQPLRFRTPRPSNPEPGLGLRRRPAARTIQDPWSM